MAEIQLQLPGALFSETEQEEVQAFIRKFSGNQLHWLSGFLTGLQQPVTHSNGHAATNTRANANGNAQTSDTLTVLYGSKSGNSKKIARNLFEALQAKNYPATLQDLSEYPSQKITEEKWVFLVVSTHGEGDPPPAAEELHQYVSGRKIKSLSRLKFAVLALGDRSYASFCQTGKDFDERFSALQATKLLNRVEADTDFEETANAWIEAVLAKLKASFAQSHGNSIAEELIAQSFRQPATLHNKPSYSRKHPFPASVLEKIQLNGRGSTKETWHLELSIENSGLVYQPGDTAGVWVHNEDTLVQELIDRFQWNAQAWIGDAVTGLPFFDFLKRKAELTTVSGSFLKALLPFLENAEAATHLNELLADKTALTSFVYGRDIYDVLEQFPATLSEKDFSALLIPLQPRLYSISSSLAEHPDELHLTIGKLQYHRGSRLHRGLASNHIADQIRPGDLLDIFILPNESFRLPEQPEIPIIMIGAGTGIAPFRAFMEERAAVQAKGKSWLFFGDRHFSTDFLYQTEWQRLVRQGSLTRMNTAFSRDRSERMYVQDRLLQHARELMSWLEAGAYIYVCGDAKKMAADVKKTFTQIVQQNGERSPEESGAFIRQLVRQGRYREDIY